MLVSLLVCSGNVVCSGSTVSSGISITITAPAGQTVTLGAVSGAGSVRVLPSGSSGTLTMNSGTITASAFRFGQIAVAVQWAGTSSFAAPLTIDGPFSTSNSATLSGLSTVLFNTQAALTSAAGSFVTSGLVTVAGTGCSITR